MIRSARAGAGLVLALLVFLLLSAGAIAAPTFPPLTGRVVDQANLLSPQTEAALTERLATLETETGRQLVVVTLETLQGYEIEEYGYQLGRAWGIGRAAEDDGVLLIVAPNERKVRIEVGYGLEGVLTDALSSVILSERVLPQFRAGDMEAGVVSGAQALADQLALPPDEARARVNAAMAAAEEAPAERFIPIIIIAFILLSLLSSTLRAFGVHRRYRDGDVPWWLWPIILSGGGGGGGGRGGGFGGGGGGFGGGGASGSW